MSRSWTAFKACRRMMLPMILMLQQFVQFCRKQWTSGLLFGFEHGGLMVASILTSYTIIISTMLTCMSLDCGSKPGRTHVDTGRTCTQGSVSCRVWTQNLRALRRFCTKCDIKIRWWKQLMTCSPVSSTQRWKPCSGPPLVLKTEHWALIYEKMTTCNSILLLKKSLSVATTKYSALHCIQLFCTPLLQ